MSLPASTTPQDQLRLDNLRKIWNDAEKKQEEDDSAPKHKFPHPHFLFFWGHSTNKSYIDQACLSQWFPSKFVDPEDDAVYASAEHWMMVQKARLFAQGDHAEANLALVTEMLDPATKPPLVKKLGRCVEGFDEDVWGQHRFEIVKKGTFLKFSQNKELARFLINTADKVDYFVEASPLDPIWGIGLAASDEASRNPNTWIGLNLLGFALTEVRDQLVTNRDLYLFDDDQK